MRIGSSVWLQRVAAMVEAGVPVARAVAASRGMLPRRRDRLLAAEATSDVVAGRALADALGGVLAPRAVAVLREGAARGEPARALDAAARQVASDDRIARTARSLRLTASFAIFFGLVLAPAARWFLSSPPALPYAAAAAAAGVLAGCIRQRRRLRWARLVATVSTALSAGARPAEAVGLAATGGRTRETVALMTALEWWAWTLGRAEERGLVAPGARRRFALDTPHPVLGSFLGDLGERWLRAHTTEVERWAVRTIAAMFATTAVLIGWMVLSMQPLLAPGI